jgi:hypothetical protein
LFVFVSKYTDSYKQWVEMSEKESIDKADRALRDASRNVAKRTLGSFSIQTQSTGDNDTIGKAATTTTTGGGVTVEAQRVPEALISGIGPTHRSSVTSTTPLLPPLFVSCDVRSAAGIDLHAPPSKEVTTTAMTTTSGETTTTMVTAAEFDEAIFDTSESLFAALRPHPERAWSSSTLHHTNTVVKPTSTGNNGTTMMTAMEPLDYSCGSLFEPQTALEMWGHDHSYNSSSSLSVADLILNGQSSLQQVLDEETKTALEDNNAKQGAAKSPHHLLHTNTNSSTNSSARSLRSSRSSSRGGGMPGIKPDSAMSLDLYSNSCMDHSIVLIGDHPHQQQPLPSVHHQPHHQSSISLWPKGAASMIDMVDEDMLVDSFNQSLDFVNNIANHHHNHGNNHHHHHQHHNLHQHHHHNPPPLAARSSDATGNVHPATGSNSSPTVSATAAAPVVASTASSSS